MSADRRQIENTGRNGKALRVRPKGNRPWAKLLCLCSCLTANAAFVAVEFGGWVMGSDLGHRPGARVTGYFTYQSGDPSGPQTASRPTFVFEIPEDGVRFERSSYGFAIYNNALPGDTPGDGFALQFSYPQGYGALSLNSSNTSLFASDLTPPTIPAVEQFNANRTMYVTVDEVQPYRSTRVEIDRLAVVPGSGLGRPVIFGVVHTAGAVSFRFLTEPSTRYAVQLTDNPAATSWTTVTNIGPTMEPIALVNNGVAGLQQRFYRIQKNPN